MRSALVALLCAAIVAAGAGGCRKKPAPPGDAGTAASASSGSAPSPTGSATLRADPGWPEARTGDPLDLARLADKEGASTLGEVAGDPGAADDDRKAAIRALAFVADPTPALSTLTALVLGTHLERSVLALETLAAVAGVRHHQEELEPGAWRACATALLGALGGMPKPRRDLAQKALLGMADRGAVLRSAIPP